MLQIHNSKMINCQSYTHL